MIVIDETHAVGDTFIHDGIKLKVVEGMDEVLFIKKKMEGDVNNE